MTEIDINWEGPFPVLYNRDTGTYHLSDDVPINLRSSPGVYQIYGDHPVYGRDSLLYIGETSPSKEGKGLEDRIKTHLGGKGRFWGFCGVSVRLGTIFNGENQKPIKDASTIIAVESLLIAANIPALNRNHIDNPQKHATRNMIVRNWDFKGDIIGECSGKYWWR